jgi:hypothetical protein
MFIPPRASGHVYSQRVELAQLLRELAPHVPELVRRLEQMKARVRAELASRDLGDRG